MPGVGTHTTVIQRLARQARDAGDHDVGAFPMHLGIVGR